VLFRDVFYDVKDIHLGTEMYVMEPKAVDVFNRS
jgi:hypothetical protein